MVEQMRDIFALEVAERKDALFKRAVQLANMDSDEEREQEKLDLFVAKLGRDEEYPISSMKKLMMSKLEEFNLKNENEFTDSKMVSIFA